MSEKLVYYKGRYWSWDGSKDHRDNWCLVDIGNTAEGESASASKCREVVGDEYVRQMDAIRYFRERACRCTVRIPYPWDRWPNTGQQWANCIGKHLQAVKACILALETATFCVGSMKAKTALERVITSWPETAIIQAEHYCELETRGQQETPQEPKQK